MNANIVLFVLYNTRDSVKVRQDMLENGFNEDVGYLYQVQTDLEAVEQLRKELAEYKNQEKT